MVTDTEHEAQAAGDRAWLAQSLMDVVGAYGRIDLMCRTHDWPGRQLPLEQLQDARLALSVALERIEALCQASGSNVRAVVVRFEGKCDEHGNASIQLPPLSADADSP